MNSLPELPITEEIYDLNTIDLEELFQTITTQLKKLSSANAAELDPASQAWVKKAKKLVQCVELEIEERKVIENFGANCQNMQ